MCATDIKAGKNVNLRDYDLLDEHSANARDTIVEAALATLATTPLFEPSTSGGIQYAHGTLRSINPIEQVEREATRIWSGSGDIDPVLTCVVSIGSGDPGSSPVNDATGQALAQAFQGMAIEATRIESTFADSHTGLMADKRYFRFYVQQGLQGTGWDKKAKVAVEKATMDFLSSQGEKFGLEECVQRLALKQGTGMVEFQRCQ